LPITISCRIFPSFPEGDTYSLTLFDLDPVRSETHLVGHGDRNGACEVIWLAGDAPLLLFFLEWAAFALSWPSWASEMAGAASMDAMNKVASIFMFSFLD